MPVHWEPSSFDEFRRALNGKRCEVVLHKWTRDWARNHGWPLRWFRFNHRFVERVTSSEQCFWQAYNDGAFNLHLCAMKDLWGR